MKAGDLIRLSREDDPYEWLEVHGYLWLITEMDVDRIVIKSLATGKHDWWYINEQERSGPGPHRIPGLSMWIHAIEATDPVGPTEGTIK